MVFGCTLHTKLCCEDTCAYCERCCEILSHGGARCTLHTKLCCEIHLAPVSTRLVWTEIVVVVDWDLTRIVD